VKTHLLLGYVRTYIILPSTIYGLGSGPVFSAGLANPHSVQIPQLIKSGLARGRVGVIGKGENVWPHVHISDIADLYMVNKSH
jgi:nucleoside-diphosphate-sugar epimerase